jgi:hypothetical protein
MRTFLSVRKIKYIEVKQFEEATAKYGKKIKIALHTAKL